MRGDRCKKGGGWGGERREKMPFSVYSIFFFF